MLRRAALTLTVLLVTGAGVAICRAWLAPSSGVRPLSACRSNHRRKADHRGLGRVLGSLLKVRKVLAHVVDLLSVLSNRLLEFLNITRAVVHLQLLERFSLQLYLFMTFLRERRPSLWRLARGGVGFLRDILGDLTGRHLVDRAQRLREAGHLYFLGRAFLRGRHVSHVAAGSLRDPVEDRSVR